MTQQLDDNKLIKIIENIIEFATNKEMSDLARYNEIIYQKKLTEKYQDFSISYPGLFNTIVDDPKKFDMNRLRYMLNMKKKINNKSITFEEASTKIGQEYYDEFAKPLVDKIPNKH